MIFAAQKQQSLEDFVALTGLKRTHAKACFDQFGGYAPALASFAQSYTSLPRMYFDREDAVKLNIMRINEELKLIYKRAREIKNELGKATEDKTVWSVYYTHKSAPQTNQESVENHQKDVQPKPFGMSFGQVTAANAKPAPGPMSFGFGTTLTSTSTVGVSTNPTFAGFGQLKKDELKPVNEAPREREVRYCKPSHFTGPFFDMPLFWKEEVEGKCPLLNLDNGFLQDNRHVLRKRLEVWLTKASFFRKSVEYVEIEDEDEETVRVIIKDADRTFFHPDHRKKFVAFLNAMSHEFKAYGQAMSYLAGLCLLVLNEEETATVLRFVLNVHIPGHWAAEAVGFASSAWVVESFMKDKFPDVAKHLEDLKFWPDTYLQKILTGLCIHVLNFKHLFQFLDLFMNEGMKFLIKFCLAIVEHFRTNLLNVKSSNEANEVYEIMRLDSKVTDFRDVEKILQRAKVIDLGPDGESIDVLRMKVYDQHIAPRLQRAPKTEVFEPCEVCEERRPTWWNDSLGAVCSDCKDAAPGFTYTKY